MNQTQKLLQSLKNIMSSKGITYRELAKALRLSEPTIKRCLNQEEVLSVKRLESICDVIGSNLLELARLSDISRANKPNVLTLEQEEVLSQDLNLFKVFYLVLRQWDLKKIEEKFQIPKLLLEKSLIQLDRLKLIEFHPGGKVKVLVSKNIKWRKNGPLYKIFESEMRNSFLERDFKKSNESFIFLSGNLTLTSQLKVKEKIARLEREIEDILEADSLLEKTSEDSTAVMMAMGPLRLSIFK